MMTKEEIIAQNEIIEMAEQAGSTHKQNLGVYQFYTDELEKFAELIVRKCAQVDADFVPGYGLEPFSKRFKEHYGVEE